MRVFQTSNPLTLQTSNIMRFPGFDIGRFLGVLLIVVLHAGTAIEYVGVGIEKAVWEWLCFTFAPLALPSFFFLSGYLTLRSQAPYRTQLIRRVKHLAIPYFAWNFLCIGLFLVMSQSVPRVGMRVVQFELNTFHGIVSKLFDVNVFPLVQPLWYLRTLFLLFLLSPLLRACYRWQWLSALLLLVLSLLGDRLLTIPTYAIGCFFFGGWIAHRYASLEVLYPWRWTFLVITLLTLGFTTVVGFVPFVTTLLAIVSAPTLWVFAQRWTLSIRNLANLSFFVYAGHFLFASTLLHLLGPRLPDIPGMLTLLCGLFILLGTTMCLWVWLLGNRLCPRILCVFDGSL